MFVHSIGSRVTVAMATLLLIFSVTGLFIYARQDQAVMLEREVRSAREVIMMTESVRSNIQRKWELGLFSPAQLRNLENEGGAEAREKILAAVPVVAAWMTAANMSKVGEFEFRTPRRQARNKAHEPDSIEANALDRLAADPQMAEFWMVDESMNALRYFRPVRLSLECLYCHGDPAQSKTVWGRDDGKDITGFPMDGKKVGDMHGAFEVIKPLAKADAARAQTIEVAMGLVVGVLALMLWAIRWISKRFISRPIDSAVAQLVAASEAHDLTFRLDETGSDELVRLGKGFNHFVATLQSLLQKVNSSVAQVADSAKLVKHSSEETARGMLEQQSKTEQVATAMTEMTSTVEEIARNATFSAEMAERAEQQTKVGKSVVDDAILAINHLANEVERAAEGIKLVETNSVQISTILDVVKDISEQTNLLALNAAIEAARAGEQGRGFAVVADEVRTLATRTQQSTLKIREMIEHLQSGTREAVRVMEEGRQKAREGVEITAKAGDALETIARAVGEISGMTTSIASAAVEQAAVSEDINNNVLGISEEGIKAGRNAHETSLGSQKMADLADNLLREARTFKA